MTMDQPAPRKRRGRWAFPLATTGLRTALASATLLGATGCAGRLDRTLYVASATDPCDALGSGSASAGPVDVYRVSVIGRKHAFDQTQVASDWVPAAAVDQVLHALYPTTKPSAPATSPAAGSEAADPAEFAPPRPMPVASFGPDGPQHVSGESRLVIFFGPDARGALDEWIAAATTGNYSDPKVQVEAERAHLRAQRCWLTAIHASLAAPASATPTAVAASSEGSK